ncbi:3-hydroxyacyl-ACP dehydratase FabZ [Chlamydiota bacterium]
METFDTDTIEVDVQEIMQLMPHRYPFLLVDRIIEFDQNTRAIGLKNVTINEDFFNGHFPGRPVMPGVLIVEALAQVAGVLIKQRDECKKKLFLFMGMNNVKFRQMVVPGDQLLLEVELTRLRSKMGIVFGKAYVKDKVVAEAQLSFAMVDNE